MTPVHNDPSVITFYPRMIEFSTELVQIRSTKFLFTLDKKSLGVENEFFRLCVALLSGVALLYDCL